MNILGLSNYGGDWGTPNGWGGSGYHRVLLPLGMMKGVHAAISDGIYDATKWNIIVYNTCSQFDGMWQEVKSNVGCKVVFDVDDYWHLPKSHPLHNVYGERHIAIERNIIDADLVTVPHETLAIRVRKLNPNVVVLPNALPYGESQFTENKKESDKLRVFWAGGLTHENDMKLLKPLTHRLQKYSDKIQMVLGAYCDEQNVKPIWDKILSCFTNEYKLPYITLPNIAPTSFMTLYENADIVVVPLENSSWHSCKSNLKLLESASKRLPVIVSKVEPYSRDKEAPVLWVDNEQDWIKHIRFLINNPNAKEGYGNRLYEWAKGKYNFHEINNKRLTAYKTLLNK